MPPEVQMTVSQETAVARYLQYRPGEEEEEVCGWRAGAQVLEGVTRTVVFRNVCRHHQGLGLLRQG